MEAATRQEEKEKIRIQAKKRRSLADRKKKDPMIAAQVRALKEYQEAKMVFIYVSFRDEVDTTGIMESAWREGKRVACPRIQGKEMTFYEVFSWDDFHEGMMGILEPNETTVLVTPGTANSFMLMPGLAFDRERRRIGYGGGYYDRYLKIWGGTIPTAALAYTEQIWEQLPSEKQDIRPDRIITEEGIIYGSDYNGTVCKKGGSQPECDGQYGKKQSAGDSGRFSLPKGRRDFGGQSGRY